VEEGSIRHSEHMTATGPEEQTQPRDDENQRPPEPLSLSPSTQFFDFFLPTGIGLFPAPPRKSQPREGKEVGRKRTGKVEKSRPSWRARPCSFSPRPRHLVASLPPLVYSSSPVQTGASRAVLPLLLAQVQA
jgi:hypothetical protein